METEIQNPATAETTTADRTAITGIPFACVYVDDLGTACAFYGDLLGLEKQSDMGPDACFFRVGADSGLYLEGKNNAAEIRRDSVRAAFALSVPSASALYAKLESAGTRFVHSAPMDMGQDYYWFQFYDPAGNIIEVLGGN
jgi:predicted enzyme related to lactoylglutathione lyase